MEQVLLVVQVIVAIGLIGMVLIQRSDSDGFGLGGGGGNNLMSGRSAASAMTRITAIFATIFIVNSLALGVIAARGHKSSIVETIEEQQSTVPSVPLAGAGKKADVKADEKMVPEEKAVPKVPVEGEVKKPATEEKPTEAVKEPAAKKPAKKAAQPAEEDPNNAENSNE